MRRLFVRSVNAAWLAGAVFCAGCDAQQDPATLVGALGADLFRQVLAAWLL